LYTETAASLYNLYPKKKRQLSNVQISISIQAKSNAIIRNVSRMGFTIHKLLYYHAKELLVLNQMWQKRDW